MYRMKPDVIDQARKFTGCTSDEKLGAELGLSAATIRNLRKGLSEPSVATLFKFQAVTGKPIEGMLLDTAAAAA